MAESNLQDLQNFFNKRNQIVREEHKVMAQIIGPFIDSIENSTAIEEEKEAQKQKVMDLGSFIRSFESELHIEELLFSSVDFIIEKKGKQIGLSHYNFNANLDITNNELTKDLINKAILEKESYFEKKQNENWLLLVIGGNQDLGEYASFSKEVFSSDFQTTFDKIYLFNSLKEEVKFLKVRCQ